MSTSNALTRRDIIDEITEREVNNPPTSAAATGLPARTSEYFGINTFGVRQMRDKLPRDVYAKLLAAIRHGKKLDLDVAPRVAQAIKEWALERGATHYT